jgi:hypothetical protein
MGAEDIKRSAAQLAWDMFQFYEGNQTGKVPGILPGPPDDGLGNYYWWEGGAMMGTYVDYWHLTGDSSYNKVIMEGMLHQVGDNRDYQPVEHTASLGNDDQGSRILLRTSPNGWRWLRLCGTPKLRQRDTTTYAAVECDGRYRSPTLVTTTRTVSAPGQNGFDAGAVATDN